MAMRAACLVALGCLTYKLTERQDCLVKVGVGEYAPASRVGSIIYRCRAGFPELCRVPMPVVAQSLCRQPLLARS